MITDLNVILKEWAYRVDNGKPNPKNGSHIYHLKEILIEYKWPFSVIDKLLYNLTEQETKFKARSKETGKLRYFKDKESMDNALDAGTVEPVEKPDKKDDKPDSKKVTNFQRPSDDDKKPKPRGDTESKQNHIK